MNLWLACFFCLSVLAAPETALDADAFFIELTPYCTYPAAPPPEGPLEIVHEFE